MADEVKAAEDTTAKPEDTPAVTPPVGGVADEVLKPEDKTGEKPEDKTEDKPEDKPEDSAKFDPTVWSEERDEVADSVFQLLHEGGATPDEAKSLLYDAVQSGKLEDIDRDALVEKVGKARANLILVGVKDFINERKTKADAAVAAVHKAAGGEEGWKAVAKWVNDTQPEGLYEYRAMIDAGGRQADLAVRQLVQLHNADPKTKSIGKVELVGDSPSNKQEQGISQREYGDRLDKLHKTRKATDDARAELRRLRRLGRKQGL